MLRNRRDRFGSATIFLHWAIAVVITGLIGLGYVTTRPDIDPGLQFNLYQWHKSFGMTALILALIRLVWWVTSIYPAAVDGLSPLETRAASVTHALMLMLTLAVPFTGWAVASASTLNIPTLLFDRILIPHLPMEKSAEAEVLWTMAHAWLAYGLAGLIVLHAGAALRHHFWRRDAVLARMIGIVRQDAPSNPDQMPADRTNGGKER